MFRSNKVSLASANDIIDSLMESSEIMSGTGAVVITQKNGRKTINTGAIYLRDGLIYAADIESHHVPIGKRIETGALVPADDLKEVFGKVGGDITSPRIVDYLLQNHMISEKMLSSYVKEHFIEILGKIMSWNDSLGEWHPNAVTKDFVMPFVTFDRIRQILAQRKNVYGEFLRLTEKFMRPEELPELTFSLLKAPDAGQSPTATKIISLCDSKHTIDDIATATGVTFYNVFQTIVGLWREGLLALNIGGIRLPYTAILVEPEPEPVPVIVELTNPPIPVYEDAKENTDSSAEEASLDEEDSETETANETTKSVEDSEENPVSDDSIDDDADVDDNNDVVFINPQNDSADIPRILADYAEKNEHSFHHFTSSDQEIENDADSEPVFHNPVKDDDETPQPLDNPNAESPRVLPKGILERRNKVEEISNKLNQLEINLANCEKELQDKEDAIGALEERKNWLKNELGEVAEDYRRIMAETDKITETYESIRKEVEDTINSFTFIEGE